MRLTSIPSEYRTRLVYTCFSILFKLLELQLFIFITQVLVRLVLGCKAPQTAAAPVLPDADYILSAGGCICALGFKVCRRQSCCIFSIRHPCLDSTAIRPTYQNVAMDQLYTGNAHQRHQQTYSSFGNFPKSWNHMEPLNKKSKQSKQLLPCSQLW